MRAHSREPFGHNLNVVLSLSKDGPRSPTPWFDKLTTALASALLTPPESANSIRLHEQCGEQPWRSE
jgi:hypothetical protein